MIIYVDIVYSDSPRISAYRSFKETTTNKGNFTKLC